MKNKFLTITLIILVCITLVGVVALILTLNFTGDRAEKPRSIDEIVKSTVDIEEITTNLQGREFIRLTLKIETNSKKAAIELEKRDFQVKNLVIQELSEMEAKDFEGKAGKRTFEESIKDQLNPLMQKGEIDHVYIVSYIIQ